MHTRDFWASQMRTDLDYQVWRIQYLGREAMEEELDWLVDAAMSFNWHRIEKMLDDRLPEKHVQSQIPGSEELAGSVLPPQTKLRRALALEDVTSKVSVIDCDDDNMSETWTNTEEKLLDWSDCEDHDVSEDMDASSAREIANETQAVQVQDDRQGS